jgi:hypothetical protein
MSTSALDVQDTLLEAMAIEAKRILACCRGGELDVKDRISLTHYLHATQACAADEWRRLKELDPKKLHDEMLAKLLAEPEPNGKRQRAHHAG